MITQSSHPCEIRRILADEGEKAVAMRTFVTDAMLAPGRLTKLWGEFAEKGIKV